MIEPYPLRWPEGWPRTPAYQRQTSKFKVSGFAQARDRLINEVKLLGGRDVVITSNLPTRLDGLPYANASEPADPGIAAYWRQPKGGGWVERSMACDRWRRARDNMHAVELSIAALRGLSRWGSSTIVDRAFAGFAALPPVPEIDWRAELEMSPIAGGMEAVRATYRALAAKHHPDRGGDPEKMSRLNRAWEAAQRELAGGTP